MTPEQKIGELAIIGFAAIAVHRLYVLFKRNPPKATPDPWGQEIEEAVQRDDAQPVCHRCFTPQDSTGWFCEKCGTAVGPYNNWMPYLYVFSQGEVLRNGTAGRFRINGVTILGYIFYSFSGFLIFAPIYLVFFFKNVSRLRHLLDEENISNQSAANYDAGQSE